MLATLRGADFLGCLSEFTHAMSYKVPSYTHQLKRKVHVHRAWDCGVKMIGTNGYV